MNTGADTGQEDLKIVRNEAQWRDAAQGVAGTGKASAPAKVSKEHEGGGDQHGH